MDQNCILKYLKRGKIGNQLALPQSHSHFWGLHFPFPVVKSQSQQPKSQSKNRSIPVPILPLQDPLKDSTSHKDWYAIAVDSTLTFRLVFLKSWTRLFNFSVVLSLLHFANQEKTLSSGQINSGKSNLTPPPPKGKVLATAWRLQ
jgi:hypothetical protein